MKSSEPEVKRIFCAIVGAGMCGVSLGYSLVHTKTLKHDEFVIFDKNADFGGVWERNKYPGAACDIPSHAYVMRCFLNPGQAEKISCWLFDYKSTNKIMKFRLESEICRRKGNTTVLRQICQFV